MGNQTKEERRFDLLMESVSDVEAAVEDIVPVTAAFCKVKRAQDFINQLDWLALVDLWSLPAEWLKEFNKNLEDLRAAVSSGNEDVAKEKGKIILELCKKMEAQYQRDKNSKSS